MSSPRPTAESYIKAVRDVQIWIEKRGFAGHEPYDLLNSPYFASRFAHSPAVAPLLIQVGRRFGGRRLRSLLRVPASSNPKALGLLLAGYCDLAQLDQSTSNQVALLKAELKRLRSPNEEHYCWGYDWDFISLRGAVLNKFSPNSIATCFCAEALLDAADCFSDREARDMGESAARFLVARLNRSVDTPAHLCFSYTPQNRTRIFNSSVLVGALLARLAEEGNQIEFSGLSRRTMQYLVDHQAGDGSWSYGEGTWQRWIDGFHTGYNLCALLDYRSRTSDTSFDAALDRGYEFYKRSFLCSNGAPKYFHNRLYPIDVHSCSQAILTLCAFRDRDPEALHLAQRTADWTLANMRSPDGSFFYQRHRLWVDRTPYIRWGQAWMFRALARLERTMSRAHGRREVDGTAVTSVN